MPSRKSRKKWNPSSYTTAAKKLRAAGFNVSLRSGKKAAPHDKAAVRRLWNQNVARVSAYTNPENRFVFKRTTAAQKRQLKKVTSKEQQMPRGVFLQFPKGVKAQDAKFKIRGKTLEVIAKKRRDVIVRLDPEVLAVDPEQAIRDAIGERKPAKISLMVNGFRSVRHPGGFPVKLFFHYFSDELLPELQDEDRRGGSLDDDTIADIFSLRLIYGRKGSEISRHETKQKKSTRNRKKIRKMARKKSRKK